MLCQRCGGELSDDPLWTSSTIACPYCGQPAPALSELESQEARVAALSRRAAAELFLFLGTVAIVAGACWGIARLIDVAQGWWGRDTTQEFSRVTRRDGPDYYLRNAALPLPGSQRALTLDALLSFPVREPRDVSQLFEAVAGSKESVCPKVEMLPFTDTLHRTTGCLIASIIDTRQLPYSLWLIDFARSGNRVLRTLRDQLRIPPPAGHAVVRVFEPGDPIPAPLLEFHQRSPEISGAAFGGPYIAIFDTESNIDAVLAHELVHAYLGTVMGRGRANLPAWFHEGIALSLARTPLSIAAERGNDLRFTSLTAQYQEYKHLFDRVESRLGRERYLAVLRECVTRRSDRPLLDATGSKDYADLRRFAAAWVLADIRPYLLMLLAGVAVAAANFLRRRRKHNELT